MKEKYDKEKRLEKAIIDRIEENFGSKVKEMKRLAGGINNICYLIVLSDGRKLLAKKYYFDDQKRLEREFEAVSYFDKIDLFNVPKPYIEDKKLYLGVYSFIDGKIKGPREIGKKEILDLVNYAVKLHSIRPTKTARSKVTLTAIRPAFALAGHMNNLKFKLERFKKYFSGLSDSDSLKKKIEKLDFLGRLDVSIERLLEEIPEKELNRVLKWNERRINHIDFGFHNVIYKTNDRRDEPYFIDYELSGWDDPARMIGDFMTHDKNRQIPHELRELFLKEYKKARDLGPKERNRLDMAVTLMDTEWVATYLWSIAPERLAIRKLSIKNFNLESFVVGQLQKVGARLKELEK